MRFDCRQINDILTFWPQQATSSAEPPLNVLISACNDGFLRLFNLVEHTLIATVKSVFGAPLCLDLSRDNANLLAVGFEDDSFVLYGLSFGVGGGAPSSTVTPLCRGVGHKSFVCQVKFDNYMMDFLS
jgi:hypothetical protein